MPPNVESLRQLKFDIIVVLLHANYKYAYFITYSSLHHNSRWGNSGGEYRGAQKGYVPDRRLLVRPPFLFLVVAKGDVDTSSSDQRYCYRP